MHLTGYVAEQTAAARASLIDRAAGRVNNVRLVNCRSDNRRKYPAKVLAAAGRLYVGAAVHVGHHLNAAGQPVTPTPESKLGRVEAVRPAAGGGLIGDLRLNPRHPFADRFLWACENDPALYSLSPLHKVRWANAGLPDADGDLVAEEVVHVLSVDIVTAGGTTSTIFESFDPAPRRPLTPADRIVAAIRSDAARKSDTPLARWLAAAVAG